VGDKIKNQKDQFPLPSRRVGQSYNLCNFISLKSAALASYNQKHSLTSIRAGQNSIGSKCIAKLYFQFQKEIAYILCF